jgi:glycerophosphoryl diester phosphodiesterase
MPRLSRRAFLASAAALAFHSVRGSEPRRRFSFFQPVNPPRAAQVMAHRGMALLAPENTRLAVEACAQDSVEWAEIDVRLSRDGKHVIFHDGRLDAKTDGKGPVNGLTLEELRRLDAGAWFAPRFKGARLNSLAEVLALAKGKVNLYLDCKNIDAELLVKEVRTAGMERQVIAYGNPAIIAAIRKAGGGTVAVMAKYRPEMNFATLMRDVAPDAAEIDAADVTAELCRRFHGAGVVVQAKVLGRNWDNVDSWRKVIAAGVDWLQTDDPAGVLMTAMRDRVHQWPVMMSCHRGANRYAPENTLPAIRIAVALGADFVEIDIRTTRDGKFVLMHDATVNRTTNGKGRVNDLRLAEIRDLDAGSWFGRPFQGVRVPTLDEALEALGKRASIYLDAKDISPEALASAVKSHGLLERHVVYQGAGYLTKLKGLDHRLRPLAPLRTAADLSKLESLRPYGVDASWRALSKGLMDECHKKGIKVFSDALGANETIEQYRRAMEWGIDVIQTDHPLRVMRAVELLTKS